MEVGEDGCQERRQGVFESIFSDFKLIDQNLDIWCEEALVAYPCRSHFKVFWLLITFNELFRNFDLIAVLCVAKGNPSIFKPARDLMQIGIKLGLNLIDLIVCVVKIFVNPNLWLWDLCSLATRHFFPLDELVELCDSSFETLWLKTIFSLGFGSYQGDKPFRLKEVLLPQSSVLFNRLFNVFEDLEQLSKLLQFDQRDVFKVDSFHTVLDRVGKDLG